VFHTTNLSTPLHNYTGVADDAPNDAPHPLTRQSSYHVSSFLVYSGSLKSPPFLARYTHRTNKAQTYLFLEKDFQTNAPNTYPSTAAPLSDDEYYVKDITICCATLHAIYKTIYHM
jgi:hypothetical protein